MIFLRPALLLAASTICTLLPCHAQQGANAKVRFVSFPEIDDPKPVELLLADKKTVLVDLPSNSISSVYAIKKPVNWTLGKSVIDANGKPSFQVYGTVTALAAAEQIILVVRNGKTDADGFKLIPFVADPNDFGHGKYMFLNASNVDIACVLGDAKLAIKPLDYKIVEPKPSEVKNGRELLYVYLYFRKNNELKLFYSSTWLYSNKARNMVFLYQDKDNMSLKMHIVPDFV